MRKLTITLMIILSLVQAIILFMFLKNYKKMETVIIDNNILKEHNSELEGQIKDLKNDIQLREDEIAYWGMKYDSVNSVLKQINK
jgi:hypothetical protein